MSTLVIGRRAGVLEMAFAVDDVAKLEGRSSTASWRESLTERGTGPSNGRGGRPAGERQHT